MNAISPLEVRYDIHTQFINARAAKPKGQLALIYRTFLNRLLVTQSPCMLHFQLVTPFPSADMTYCLPHSVRAQLSPTSACMPRFISRRPF